MKYRPYAFTEQGILMLSSHADLARKPEELEKKYDSEFRVVFDAIRQLLAPKEGSNKKIGVQLREKRAAYSARG
jgi:hypothetical protein